jgi:Tol biopolymer transport system component
MSTDRDSFVTARTEVRGSVWIGDGGAVSGTEVVLPIAGPGLSTGGAINWAGDRLMYTAMNTAVYSLPPDGGMPEEILTKARAPVVSPDGKTIVYLSAKIDDYGSLSKADASGRNATKLFAGNNFWPSITTDNQNVIFVSGSDLRLRIMPLAGGKPALLTEGTAAVPDISPDGKSLAFASQENNQRFISICELPECAKVRHVKTMEGLFKIRWNPDGSAIAYASANQSGANIWVQPLNGSTSRQLTHFTDGKFILDFAWSRDGKHFAVARAATPTDIVLFKGLKPKS